MRAVMQSPSDHRASVVLGAETASQNAYDRCCEKGDHAATCVLYLTARDMDASLNGCLINEHGGRP